MKNLIKISSVLLLLPGMALAAPRIQGPTGLFELKGNLTINAPSDPNVNSDRHTYPQWSVGGISPSSGNSFKTTFDAVYVVGAEHPINISTSAGRRNASCGCSFTVFTDGSGTTYITGSTSLFGSKDCEGGGGPAGGSPFKSAVCTVDGKQSASSGDPSYTPKLEAKYTE